MAPESKLKPTDSRPPGRPPRSGNEPTVRAQLIDSAARLFAERGYGEASMRQIAENAGVTPAMVSYYFKDKLGLLEAVLDSVFDRLLSRTVELFEDPQQRGSAIERFIEIYLAALTAEPWIPRLLVREVLSENTPVRQRFVERFQNRFGSDRVTSDPIDAAYYGVKLWARAVQATGSVDAATVRESLQGTSMAVPGGMIHIDAENLHTWKTARIGKILADGQFKEIWSSGYPIRPIVSPDFRERRQWDAFLSKLHDTWGGWANSDASE